MIDPADGRPTRRRHRAPVHYPCASCHKTMVSKKDGLCRVCGCKKREANYKAKGIRHPKNRTFASTVRPTAPNKPRNRNNGCVPHWMIDGFEFGRCIKYLKRKHLCRDTGNPCPHNGIRDFAVLQGKTRGELYALKSNSKGGVKSGKLRGGRRGRPRKIREVLV